MLVDSEIKLKVELILLMGELKNWVYNISLFVFIYLISVSFLVHTLDSSSDESDLISVDATDMTPLETSLLFCLTLPTTITPELINEIDDYNNPRKVASEKENAAYWVRKDGSLLLISFPAILETRGKYGRTGPYFNMIENVSIFA